MTNLPVALYEIFFTILVRLLQACQTQITARAAHWVVKREKLIVCHSLELHMTLCVNFRHILAYFISKWTKLVIFYELISVLSDSLV